MDAQPKNRQEAAPSETPRALRASRLPIFLLVAAVVWAFLSPVMAHLFGLPEWFLRFDLALAWLGFGVALVFGFGGATRIVRLLVGAITLFGVLQLATALRADIALTGPALSFALFALPLAVVGTLLLVPPAAHDSRRLESLLLFLAFALVPISIIQTPFASHPDEVVGTFPGVSLGAHINGAITGAAALWILGRASSFKQTLPAFPLILVVLLSDSKQIALLLPVALILSPAPGLRLWLLRLIAPVAVAALALIGPPALGVLPEDNDYVIKQVTEVTGDAVGSGESGAFSSRKSAGTDATVTRLSESPSTILFGLGQGQSVSYIALLSDEEGGQTVGPLLGLEPSKVVTKDLAGYYFDGASFASEFSSAVGLVGDLGVLGALAFLLGLGVIALLVYRIPARVRGPAQAVALFYLALGLVYIWWEQPVLVLYVALFVGLAVVGANLPRGGLRGGIPVEDGAKPLAGESHSLRG